MTSDHKSIINNRSLNAFCCSSFHDLATHVSIHLVHRSIHLSIQCRCMIVIRILSSLFFFFFFFFSYSLIHPRLFPPPVLRIAEEFRAVPPRTERVVLFSFFFSLYLSVVRFRQRHPRSNILRNCNFVEIRKVSVNELRRPGHGLVPLRLTTKPSKF